MKYSLSHKLILGLTVLIAIGLGALYFFLYSSLSEMRNNRAEFAVGIKDSSKIVKTEEMNTKTLSAYFVKDGEEASFISSIESSCKDFTLICSITSLDESAATAESIKVFRLTVSAQGSFSNQMLLLQSFEHSPYPILISQTNLTSLETDWRGTYNIEVPVMVGIK